MVKFKKPIAGKLVDIAEASDQTFKQKMLGPGFSIIPKSNFLTAPVAGVIEMIYPTKHAFSIKYGDNQFLLIHMGVDYHVNEQTFFLNFRLNDRVSIGDLLVEINLPLFIKQTKYPEIYFTFVEAKELEIIGRENENKQEVLLLDIR